MAEPCHLYIKQSSWFRLQTNEKICLVQSCTNVTATSETPGELMIGESNMYFVGDETISDLSLTQVRSHSHSCVVATVICNAFSGFVWGMWSSSAVMATWRSDRNTSALVATARHGHWDLFDQRENLLSSLRNTNGTIASFMYDVGRHRSKVEVNRCRFFLSITDIAFPLGLF